MKKLNLFCAILFVVITAFFAGCKSEYKSEDINEPFNQSSGKTDMQPKTMESAPTSIDADKNVRSITVQNLEKQPEQNYNTQDKRMIIRSGTMNLEVDKYDDTETKIKEITNRFNGYVTNTTSSLNASGKKQGTITIRIASDKFDGVLAELSKIGKVMNQNISGKDVTEEYMDSEARLKTQRELENRLLKLLEEKTARLTDVVDVEQKLAGVRENIEKTEGRMRYLKDQASFSTLAVSVYEPSMLVTSTGGGFFYELGRGFEKGLTGFTSVLSALITFIIAFLPVLAILYIIFILVRKYLRKRKVVKTAPSV
jgi:hypothetical protein